MNNNETIKSYRYGILSETLKVSFLLLLFTVVATAQNTVIKAGHMFDARSGKMLENQIIVIQDGKIKEVGTNPKFNKDDKIIDLSAYWVLPGLMDCHVHITNNETYRNVTHDETYVTKARLFAQFVGRLLPGSFWIMDLQPLRKLAMTRITRQPTSSRQSKEVLGIEKSRGVLEPSDYADIIALNKNPIENIEAIKSVRFVMKEGKVIRQD